MTASEDIKSFLDFVSECKDSYESSVEGVKLEEKRQTDLLHEIEFAADPEEWTRIGERIHNCRVQRREYKDTMEVTEPVVSFFKEPNHKKTLDQMTQLLGKVRKQENYHQNRTYIPRVKE